MEEYNARIKNHALLFAFFARKMLDAGAEEALRRAVIRYGKQRGRRMRLRSDHDGRPATVASYLLYGEWEGTGDEVEIKVPSFSPEVNLQNLKCPWFDEWKNNGLSEYGKYYCETVDESIARGFDPDLFMDMTLSRHSDDPYCDFYFRGCEMDAEEQKDFTEAKNLLGKKAKMGWNYHVGHIYKTLYEELKKDLPDQADEIAEKAVELYGEEFGGAAVLKLMEYKDIDYDILPEYSGIGGE